MADKKDSELTVKGTIVDADLIPLLDSETVVDAEKNKTVLASTMKTYLGVILSEAVIDIGDWDMDTDGSVSVSLPVEINEMKIRHMSCIIRNDNDNTTYNLNHMNVDEIQGSTTFATSGAISLSRRSNGFFDNSSFFNDTSFNRGWIYIKYVV